MTETPEELLEAACSALACMEHIRTLAGRLAALSTVRIESLLRELVESGEGQVLSRLLQACAFNEVKLDPTLLCRCIGVCEQLPDSAPCFGYQNENAVAPLLAATTAEELSLERQAYAGLLAAELGAKFGLDPQPIRKVLKKLERGARLPESLALIGEALLILEPGPDTESLHLPRLSELKLQDLLPERPPRHSIGGDYTVRRPIPKLGRNQPCHCGSGKKYKKCCYAKDQELLRDASEYAGTTRSELKAHPGLVDDPAVIDQMRAHELKRLEPSALSANQLISGYRRALDFGFRELAFQMLVERQGRSCEEEFDFGHFEDLIETVLEAGDLELARKIRDHCRGHQWYRPHAIQFRFDLLERPQRFEALERDCRNAICGIADEDIDEDDPVIRLAYGFASRFPALAIVFSRASMAGNPDRGFDNEMLLDVIRDSRVDLDLEPGGDPAEELFDWIEERGRRKKKERFENKQIADLSGRLETARTDLDEKKRALREREQRVEELGRELKKARESVPQESGREERRPDNADANPEQTLRRLRSHVENLKAEIGSQQERRARLRKMLADERKRHSVPAAAVLVDAVDSEEQWGGVEPSGTPMLPEYGDTFRKSCNSLPPAVVAKAILAAGRFAAHEPALWRQTKPLERLPEHYRIRIGLGYRMLVHWQSGRLLRILDLIPRQELDAWIRRHG